MRTLGKLLNYHHRRRHCFKAPQFYFSSSSLHPPVPYQPLTNIPTTIVPGDLLNYLTIPERNTQELGIVR